MSPPDSALGTPARVLVIDDGSIVIDANADDLRASATALVGKADAVDAFAAGREVISRESLAGMASVTVTGLSAADREAATAAGLETAPVSLQQLIVRRTGADLEEVSA